MRPGEGRGGDGREEGGGGREEVSATITAKKEKEMIKTNQNLIKEIHLV